MRIRTASAADHDAVARIYREASLSNAGDRPHLLRHPEALDFPIEQLDRGYTVVAVGEDDSVLGFATAVPDDDGWELEDLFVDPRRMRRGVATRLVTELADRARRAGAGPVRVTANPHAAAFYRSAGFVPDGVTETRYGPAPRLRLDLR